MKGIFPRKCPECGCKKLQYSPEGLMCKKCGLIITENYYSGKMVI